jgi:hypothetical protein
VAGETEILTKAGGITTRFADPVIEPNVAEIVVAPAVWPVASPPLLTLATETLVELQVTEFVRVCVLLSL